MKTKQTKIDRSGATWLPGAMALAATSAGAQAATVQITLTGNKISITGGNQLVADLTGDLSDDVTIVGGSFTWSRYFGVKCYVNGVQLAAYFDNSFNWFDGDAKFGPGGVGESTGFGFTPISVSFLNHLTFSDSRINGGEITEGWLEVHAFNTSKTDHTVQLARLIFDDASTTRPGFTEIPLAQTEWGAVPEPSSLALLALGAGGLGLRRSRKAKAA